MTAHRRQQSIARLFPALGLVGVLLAGGLVYLSFLATDGLPWASTYDVSVVVPNAERLAPNDDVRIAGVRVGRVGAVTAGRGGTPRAIVGLKLDDADTRLPLDTRVRIRQASVLGTSYLDLTPGDDPRRLEPGGTLPLRQTTPTVQVTDLLDIFDRATRRSIQSATRDFSAGLAGRGAALNRTFAALPGALAGLTHVARAVASRPARFARFLTAWERFVAALEPARPALAGVFAGGAQTFAALDAARAAFGRSIELSPSTERAVTTELAALEPTLRSLASTMAVLRPGVPRLRPALTQATLALRAGIPALRGAPGTAIRLRSTLATLGALARRPSTAGALRKGADFFVALDRTLEVLTPAQISCNIVTLWAENFANGFGGLGFGDGPAMASVFITHNGAKNEGFQNATPSADVGINNLPNENADECEAGNEPYDGSQQLTNPAGLQSRRTRSTRPPAGVLERAARAGLLNPGARR